MEDTNNDSPREPQIGDVVKLIELTGPRMLVFKVLSDDEVECVWFDKNEGIQKSVLPVKLLVPETTGADAGTDAIRVAGRRKLASGTGGY